MLVPPAAQALPPGMLEPAGTAGSAVVLEVRGADDDVPPAAGSRRVGVPAGIDEAEARNRALAAVTTPYVAFLSAGARPRPGWLERPLQMLADDDRLSMVAPALEGAPRPSIAFTGIPYLPTRPPRAGGEEHVLFAPFQACVARTQHLRDAGGYDDRLGGPGTDLDLGWRLWVTGGSVRACPRSVVTVAPEPEEPGRRARNGLASMYKCFDDDRLSRSLPAALLCLPEFYRAEGRDPDAARRGIDEFRFLLPGLTETRRWLQGRRARPDATLLPLFGDPLGPLDKAPDQAAVAASLGLTAALGSRRRILVLTNDVLTNRMAGPAIRAWHLSDVLADEHEVCLATLTGLCTLTSPRFEARAVEPDEVMTLADWAEVIVVQGFVTEWVPALRSTSKVVVVDLYDPLHFETLELAKSDAKGDRDKRVNHAVKTLQHQLQRGDYFMCASAKQRDLWVGQLAALGRVNPQTYDEDPSLDRLIGVVPFGIPDEDPVHTRPALRGVVPGIDDDAEVLLWAGGIYNWFDPLTLIRAVHALAPRRPSLRLFFMGLRHPNPEVPQMKVATAARALADDLQLTGRVVFFNEGWVSYDDRQNYLMEADVGVSTHFLHAETAYSFRTRILDYLWAGLPIVATEGDSFADLIAAEGLGAVVPAADAGALADALDRLLGDRQDMDRCRSNADRVRNAFRWSSVVAPVGQFCRAPRRAPDLMAMEPLTGIRASPHPVMASVAQQVSKALARWAAGGGAHGELAPPPAGSR